MPMILLIAASYWIIHCYCGSQTSPQFQRICNITQLCVQICPEFRWRCISTEPYL